MPPGILCILSGLGPTLARSGSIPGGRGAITAPNVAAQALNLLAQLGIAAQCTRQNPDRVRAFFIRLALAGARLGRLLTQGRLERLLLGLLLGEGGRLLLHLGHPQHQSLPGGRAPHPRYAHPAPD